MSVSRWLAALLAVVLVTALTAPPAGAVDQQYGPQLPDNPYDGPTGTASMHGDSGASNTTPLPGPGTRRVLVQPISLAAACPTILIGSDGLPVALCTQVLGRTPRVYLLDKSSGTALASMAVAAGSLLGGVYAYLDHHDRLVLVDGDNNLIRISHSRNKSPRSRCRTVSVSPTASPPHRRAPPWSPRTRCIC
jgi:hypothetical protein